MSFENVAFLLNTEDMIQMVSSQEKDLQKWKKTVHLHPLN